MKFKLIYKYLQSYKYIIINRYIMLSVEPEYATLMLMLEKQRSSLNFFK